MPSTNKTSQGLSQYIENDMPDLDDSNSDNRIIDAKIKLLKSDGSGATFLSGDGSYKPVDGGNYPPYIGENGNWYEYDIATKTWLDSEIRAQGEQGSIGPPGKEYDDTVLKASIKSSITAFTADATHESIVNLYGRGFGKASSYSIFNATELTDGYVKIVFDGTTKDNLNSNQLAIPTLHPDTKYTIITEILSNTNTSPTVGLLISHSGWQGGPFLEQVTIGTAQKTGIIKSLVTTENPIDVPSKLIRIMSGEAANGYIIFRQMLLEGDWTNRDLPTDYWENTYNYIGLDIKNKPDRLPENYTVTFPAPSNAVAGDKLHINGVEHLNNLYGRGFNDGDNINNNVVNLTEGYAKATTIASSQFATITSRKLAKNYLKARSTYTMITDMKEISGGTYYARQSNQPILDISTDSIPSYKQVGIYKHSFKTIYEFTTQVLFRTTLKSNVLGDIVSCTVRQMLLEGDCTAAPLPADYWENTYGIYDILGYGEGNALESNAFTAGQTVTLSVGLSGAYFAGGMNKSLPLVMGGTQDLAVKQVRNMTASSAVPVGGMSGDIHIQLGTPNKLWVNENGIWK